MLPAFFAMWSMVAIAHTAVPVSLEKLDSQLKSQGFRSNLKRIKREGYYSANKGYSETKFGAWVDISAFQGQTPGRITQIRFLGINCVVSKLPNSIAAESVEKELAAAFPPLFGEVLPDQIINAMKKKDSGGDSLSPNGFRKIKVSRSEPYCDSTSGGWSVSVDLFF